MLWIVCIMVVILLYVPFVSVYFRALNTLVHEVVGHAMVSLATGGGVSRVEVFSDVSGLAWVTSKSRFGRFLTVLAGYPAASLFAALLAFLYMRVGESIVVYAVLGLVVAALVWWVRNGFGILWSFGFIALTSLIMFQLSEYTELYANILIQMLLIDSLRSTLIVMRLSIRDKENAGDATDLAKTTLLPSSLWGVLFFVQACVCTFIGYGFLFGNL